MTFFLMMVVNQEAQEKAQAQIDAVVGKDRLPSMDDRPLLPYVDAIFQETLRYSPVAPLCEWSHASVRFLLLIPLGHGALPHAAVNDDMYEGFHIPKGRLSTRETQHLLMVACRCHSHSEPVVS